MEQRPTEWLGTLKLWRHQVVREGKKQNTEECVKFLINK